MAFGHGWAHDMVVQVSFISHTNIRSPKAKLTRLLISFLIKDAQQDMAGERLKA